MNRQQKEMAQVGSVAAILVGILYFVVAAVHMLIPMEQRAAVGDAHGFYQSFSQDPTFSLIEWWALGFLALFGIAVVLAVYDRFSSLHAGWVRWTSALAILGYGVGAIIQFTSVGRHPIVAAGYVAGDASARAAIASQPLLPVDPYSVLRFGIVGFWILVISTLALRSEVFPRLWSYAGIGAGVALAFIVVAFMVGSEMMIIAGAAVGGILLAPAWFIWLGLLLRREKEVAPGGQPVVSAG